jgi:hypothetical protein
MGGHELVDNLQPETAWGIAPAGEPYEVKKGINICSMKQMKIE